MSWEDTKGFSVGQSPPRVDAKAKVLGQAKFTSDLHGSFPGLLHIKVLRSPYPHARILTLDTSDALKMPGVRTVVTGRDSDIPWMYLGPDVFSFPARDRVVWAGQPIAAVTAESVERAEEALEAIKVEYEALPHTLDVEEAMSDHPPSVIDPDLGQYPGREPFVPEAPNIVGSYTLKTGDVDKGFSDADVIVGNCYYASRISQSQLEPASCIVRSETDGGITMWTNGCGVHGVIKNLISPMFQLPKNKVRIIQMYQGGSFGNRLVPYVEPLTVLMALRTKGIVELTFTRREMYMSSPSNWPVKTYIKTGAKRDGTIIAQKIRLIKDNGASFNSFMIGRRTGSGAVCVYRIPNFHMETCGVNTNSPPVGPYRGLGCPQIEWAVESQIDMLAHKLGMSPVAIRQKNILKAGEQNAYGETVNSIGAVKCLEAVGEAIKIEEPCKGGHGPWRVGKGIAVGGKQNSPLGRAEAKVLVHDDGSVEVLYSADEQGMGAQTVMAQIASEELKIPADQIKVVRADTAVTPYDNYSASSRTTYTTGNALVTACQDAINQLKEAAAREAGVSVKNVHIEGGKAIISGSDIKEIPIPDLFKPFQMFEQQNQWGLKRGTPVCGEGIFAPAPCIMWDENGHTPRMWNWFQYNACAVEVAVNIETGQIKVMKVASASDMGFPINPKMCEGQIEGGVCMGIGFSVNEEYLYDANGVMTNWSYVDYRIPTVLDMPYRHEFKSVLAPDPLPDGPYGAKGIAESVTIPVGPAIASAVHSATGIRPKVMPMSAERILDLLGQKGEGEEDGSRAAE